VKWLLNRVTFHAGTPPNEVSPCHDIQIIHKCPPLARSYQLAFFTPGRFPASALTRNWYCGEISIVDAPIEIAATHSSQPEIAEDTSALASHYAPVLDLCEARVAVHLRELELRLRADSLRERRVANDVAESLSVGALGVDCLLCGEVGRIPLGLILREDLSLGVVTNVADVDVASNIELGRAELRHDGGLSSQWRVFKMSMSRR
jgi:hypothetical protein